MQELGDEKVKKVANQRQVGLTLIELLIVLAILSSLVFTATISWQYFYKQNQANVAIDKLYMLLTYAKSKAYQSRLPVVVCSSIDNTTCNDGLWRGSLLVFVDHNANKRLDGDDELINHQLKLPQQYTLSWKGFPKGNYLQFKPLSLLSSSNGTLILCDEHNRKSHALIINNSAMVRYAKSTNMNKEFACV
ncbi:GspH/FimT family pseudopilin [Thiotrichales bacterium 19S3-7]|nr:GspH/FimT family pseudopilin [Thiotrichales bacterium 19S3-7]MCF6801544.1 GspH/FimT family pseudopilin [Thiotrichales bacterium 19S3-11]